MPFEFTEAQELLQWEVRDFACKEIAPGARERAKQEIPPREMLKKIAEKGFNAINIPEEYGGRPGDWVSVGIVVEELSRADFSAGGAVVMPQLTHILLGGRKELHREWLPQVIKSDKHTCFCVTEPGCGSDVAAMRVRAKRDGDTYVLNGEKTSVSGGLWADVAYVFAKTDDAAGLKGINVFLVPLDLPGITRSRIPDMGFKPYGRASIFMDNVRVSMQNILLKEGGGFYTIMQAFDWFRLVLSLQALGAAAASLNEAAEYAKKRTAFGKPIALFQGVAFKIAEDATLLEAARLMCYKTLWLRDKGVPHTKETAMCKWWCPQVAVRTIHNAMLIHGHGGYGEEYPIAQRLWDVIGYEIADGTAEIQKIIISREIMGKDFTPS